MTIIVANRFLKILSSLPVTTSTGERSFLKLPRGRYYLKRTTEEAELWALKECIHIYIKRAKFQTMK
jgi:hypothetical protein